MRELAAALAGYLSFALLHAADPRRAPLPLPAWLRDGWPRAARLLAALALGLSIALWQRTQPAPAAALAAAVSLTVSATLIVLLASVAPRAIWGLAVAAPALIGALSLAGGLDG